MGGFIQIGGLELSTQIRAVKILSTRVIPNVFYLNTYMTYLMLLYTQKAIMQPILPYFIKKKIISPNCFTLFIKYTYADLNKVKQYM